MVHQQPIKIIILQKNALKFVWMKVQILEFDLSFCWPLLVEFITETVRDIGNLSTYCQKLNTFKEKKSSKVCKI